MARRDSPQIGVINGTVLKRMFENAAASEGKGGFLSVQVRPLRPFRAATQERG